MVETHPAALTQSCCGALRKAGQGLYEVRESSHAPVPAQGDVEQEQRPSPHDGGEGGPHPGAELAEVTVVHNSHQHSRAGECGELQEKTLLRQLSHLLHSLLPS